MAKGNISVDSENLFPIIKKWLYSDKDIFLRELVSNGCDAITKLKKLASIGEAELGEDAAQYLPFLWQKSANHIEAKIRTAYMNCITRLYQKNFSEALGDWCREHGVLYTGHVIEDNNINFSKILY